MEKHRKILLMFIDYININLMLYLSLFIRFEGNIREPYITNYFNYTFLFSSVILLVLYFGRIYNRIWRYASIGELINIMVNLFLGTGLVYLIMEFVLPTKIVFPRGAIVIFLILMIFSLSGSRLAWRIYKEYILDIKSGDPDKRILIYGAGDAGHFTLKKIKKNREHMVVGFVDDKDEKRGLKILGVPVLGTSRDLQKIVKEHQIDEIIIAMPSIKGKKLQDIIKNCQKTGCEVRILPPVYEILEGNIKVSNIREVQITDLLGREPVKIDLNQVSNYVKGKKVLITGAGGSIGSEIARQVSNLDLEELIILDISENSLYDIQNELNRKKVNFEIVALIKNLREGYAVNDALGKYKPDIIFHAAAHKHVPLMEDNAEEAVKNNIRGTYNLLKYADKHQVNRVVVISTDKAVNPTNIMGATKRVTELLVQHFNEVSSTNYMAVRFGNVLGSQGSVVPFFKKQIAMGGPVTVTDPEIIRYFMTIPEAVQLVIQSGAMAQGGEIFILDMGEPVKILDLAETLIRLSGLKPYEDIDIVFTGLRPGEKLYEELITSEECCNRTKHSRIFIEKIQEKKEDPLMDLIERIESNNLPLERNEIIEMLLKLVPEYKPYYNNKQIIEKEVENGK